MRQGKFCLWVCQVVFTGYSRFAPPLAHLDMSEIFLKGTLKINEKLTPTWSESLQTGFLMMQLVSCQVAITGATQSLSHHHLRMVISCHLCAFGIISSNYSKKSFHCPFNCFPCIKFSAAFAKSMFLWTYFFKFIAVL